MGRPRRKWPHYALWALEDVMAGLSEVSESLMEMQQAAIEGNPLLVVTTGSSAATKVGSMRETLIRAKTGEYEA